MAYFAEIDGSNVVVRVVVVDDKYDNEEGCDWCEGFFGGGTWVRTATDGSIRANYAGAGHTYDADADAFYAPQPFPSWSLDSAYIWQAPTAHPNNGTPVYWDEAALAWVEEQ